MTALVAILNSAQGYRTLVLNGLLLIAALTGKGIALAPEELDTIIMGVSIVGNIVLRIYTTTPVGTKAAEASP